MPAPVHNAPGFVFAALHPMLYHELLGYLAAALTTASFVPQALHTWRTRATAGISLGMYAIFTSGVALWLVYGVLISSWPLIVANTITLSLALFILALKLRHG
jgi:MtN3 and saliva related transmembrane protein